METGSPAIENREMTVYGHRVRYLRAGSGTPLVLLHGGASDSRDWLKAMPALARRHAVYAPDLIGFGQSERKPEGYYLSDLIDFVEEFIGALGLEKASLAGHSLGGRLALGVALQRPDIVDKIILTDAAGLGKTSRLGIWLVLFFNGLRALLRRPQPAPVFLGRDGDDPHWACVDDLPNITQPVLIIWKRGDPYLPLDNARRAQRLIPDSRLEIIPGIGHAPHRSDTDAFTELVGDFLGDAGRD